MNQEVSFMKAIENFDRIIKGNATEEAKEYATAMKKLFIAIEGCNATLNKTLKKIKGEVDYIN